MKENIVFRRIRGRIVPITRGQIAARAGVGSVASAIAVKSHIGKGNPDVKPHQGLRALGFAASIASGGLAAATFFSGGKKMLGGIAGSLGLDVVSTSANVASYANAGGTRFQRAKGAVRQEAINTLAGNAVFAGALLASSSSRARILGGAARAFKFAAGKAKSFL